MPKKTTYADAGVDIVKADQFIDSISKMVRSTWLGHEKKIYNSENKTLGGFASLYQSAPDQFIAASTDGVGTKLKLAFSQNKHETVGIDLVAMSVNDLLCVGARPLFFLDYLATGKLKLAQAQSVLEGIVEGCKAARCALLGGETAEMPDMYPPHEYDLAGFAVGVVSKDQLLDGSRVKAGDVILGLESSGPHSNGFSLIRKLINLEKKNQQEQGLIDFCMTPTRIYVDAFLLLQKELGHQLKGLAHITGSGFLNIPRINEGFDYQIELPDTFFIKDEFIELKKRAAMSWSEAFTTWNMGVGLVVIVESVLATRVTSLLNRAGYPTHILGIVEKSKSSTSGKKQSSVVSVVSDEFKFSLKY